MDGCYCDYGESPAVYAVKRHKARAGHACYECHGLIVPGETYERVAALYDGKWLTIKTCRRCLDVRDYVTAHAPCFCWLHGSMLDDARNTLEEYGHESAAFWIGAMKRILRAERHKDCPSPVKPDDPPPQP